MVFLLSFFLSQRGLWISLADKGNIRRILRNWPETRVALVVPTDGARVLGFGDLGVHGVGVCVSKLAMYAATTLSLPPLPFTRILRPGKNPKKRPNDGKLTPPHP